MSSCSLQQCGCSDDRVSAAVVASVGQFAVVGAQAEGEIRNNRVLARGGMK